MDLVAVADVDDQAIIKRLKGGILETEMIVTMIFDSLCPARISIGYIRFADSLTEAIHTGYATVAHWRP